ncbi:MAG TPA: phage protease [Thauera aminoaromatica]|nr:phage protease [Thauera aminoaromatica]
MSDIRERYKVSNPDWASAYCLASLGDTTTPPRERLIFPKGDFKTTKGTFVFDDEAARMVMEDWNEWTGGLPDKGAADYEHDQSKDYLPGQDKLDSASFDLEVVKGALWATNIKWTPLATKIIANREKRFTSPWWLYERSSKRIIRFINFGLVSLPATLGQKELMAASNAPTSASVQVPGDAFAGYYESSHGTPDRTVQTAVASQDPPPPAPAEPLAAVAASTSSSEPPPVPALAAAPEVTTQEKAATMAYKDPNFVATRHGYALRYMASMAMDEMMCAIHLNGEVPMLASAMNLSSVCASQAELVTHCAGAMAECMTDADADMDDDTEVDASLASVIAKLPDEAKTKVEAALASCKASKIGGLVQKAHKAALAAAGTERFGKGAMTALASLTAAKTVLSAVATITGEQDPIRAAAALAAMQQDNPALRERAEAAEKATADATAAKDAAEKKAESLAYEQVMTANKAKVPAASEEAWCRANIKTADALDAYFKAKKTPAIATNHEQPATTGTAAATTAAATSASPEQAAKDRDAIIASVEPDPKDLAGWASTGGGDERLKNLKEKKARKLGLIA